MKLKILTLLVPHADVIVITNYFEMNGFSFYVEPLEMPDDPANIGCREVKVYIPEDMLEEVDGELCDECGEALDHEHGGGSNDGPN